MGKLIIIVAIILTGVFLLGFYAGFGKGLEYGIEYSITETLSRIRAVFEKYGQLKVFEDLIKKL